jgi:GTP:adenosylcobinamide-phosphate guanylyltransferase
VTGIVLAGGMASRMPNKALLPIDEKNIVVESSAVLAMNAGCKRVVLVVGPSSPIPLVMSLRGWNADWVTCVTQPDPKGVPDAICHAVAAVDDSLYFISFCDCVFAKQSVNLEIGPHASCMPSSNVQLDFFRRSENKWMSREHRSADVTNDIPFLGWVIATREQCLVAAGCRSTVLWLNEAKVKPALYTNQGVWDVGTPEGYLQYLKENT